MLICVPVYVFYFSVRHSLVLVDEEELLLLFRAFIFLSDGVPTILCPHRLLTLFILLFVSLFFTHCCSCEDILSISKQQLENSLPL